MMKLALQIAVTGLVGLFAGADQAMAQPKLPRLCFLTFDPGSPQALPARWAPFFASLDKLGYVDGKTVTIDYLFPDGRGSEQFPDLVIECLRRKPDVIAVTTTPAGLAAKAATKTVPIVMVSLSDPVQTGLVSSLAAPGGNVTGMANMGTELAAKRLSLLKEAVPRLSRVLVLTYLADPIARFQIERLTAAAPLLGLTLVFQDIKSGGDIENAFENGLREQVDGLMTITSSIFAVERKPIATLAARHGLPAIYPYPLSVREAGGLMAYHVDEPDIQSRAAGYVDRVLKGEKPSVLPVQQPIKFNLAINLKTAKALGLELPATVLLRVDEVIE